MKGLVLSRKHNCTFFQKPIRTIDNFRAAFLRYICKYRSVPTLFGADGLLFRSLGFSCGFSGSRCAAKARALLTRHEDLAWCADGKSDFSQNLVDKLLTAVL